MAAMQIPQSTLNRDWQVRDAILGITVKWGEDDSGGIFHVERLDAMTLESLLRGKFIDPSDQQNESPTVAEFAEFMRAHPGTTAFGYAVSPHRADYRVSIEGIRIPKERVTASAYEAARSLCHDADEMTFAPDVYCWWD